MNLKGQGALEYLLLIGGALIVAAIVLTVLPGLAEQAAAGADAGITLTKCAPYNNEYDCTHADVDGSGTVPDCAWVDTDGDGTTDACKPPELPAA